MKNILLVICLFVCQLSVSAQNVVRLSIQHKLGPEEFSSDKISENNLLTPFKVTRLQYYISEISLIHDGGQITSIDDYWILVDAKSRIGVELGVYNIDKLEKLIFHIGVDPAHNNADPATYPVDHPLALKNPSMHWGWTSGYNFVALEGLGDINTDKVFQIHALGNENYKKIELEMPTEAHDNYIDLIVEADYSFAMTDLDASIGIFYHGHAKQARSLMDNFEKYVFSASATSSTNKYDKTQAYPDFYPNLVSKANASIVFNCQKQFTGDVVITDMNGKVVQKLTNISDGMRFSLELTNSGTYLVNFMESGKIIYAKKLIFTD